MMNKTILVDGHQFVLSLLFTEVFLNSPLQAHTSYKHGFEEINQAFVYFDNFSPDSLMQVIPATSMVLNS